MNSNDSLLGNMSLVVEDNDSRTMRIIDLFWTGLYITFCRTYVGISLRECEQIVKLTVISSPILLSKLKQH